jgi:hypothetical protein
MAQQTWQLSDAVVASKRCAVVVCTIQSSRPLVMTASVLFIIKSRL